MDESLRYPYRVPVHAPVKVRSAPRLRTKRERVWRLPHLALPNFLERRSRLQPIVFLTTALSLTAAGVLGTLYGPGYRVSVDGVDLGLVDSPKAIVAAAARVEDRASEILGYDYDLNQDISHSFEVCLREDVKPITDVETYLFDQIGEVMKTSVLTVKGQMLGAADNDAALTAMLEGIKAPYITENTVLAEFVEPLSVSREYTATSAIRSIDSLREMLTSNSLEQVDYTVRAGDTFSAIANSNGMRVAELQLLNPDVNIDRLQIGQTLTISKAVPFLSVRTVDNVTYDGPVAFEVKEITDDSMYQGNKKVVTPGVEGWATYNADVTSINGEETERVINSTQVHTEPVTQVVAVGTKPRPKTMATGSFQWPIYGKITSGYGNRYIFGSTSFHSGIDINGYYGQPIAAADGGKVVYAGTGTGSYWSYGNYVVIDHENGLQTIYAHCSSLVVRAGERVYKGQTIAKVGSTGRSTGNHCHFQVKVNGTTVSPYKYLP